MAWGIAGREKRPAIFVDGLLVQNCESPHRGAGSALELQRNAEELELAFSDQLFQIYEPLPMTHAEITAKAVLREVRLRRLIS